MEFPAVKPADSADDFLLFSDAINRLTQGMWGGLRRPDPVVSAKSKFKNASVGFGPWRELAARRLTAAALNGKLTVYIIPNQDIQPGNNSVAAKQIHSGDYFARIRFSMRANLTDFYQT